MPISTKKMLKMQLIHRMQEDESDNLLPDVFFLLVIFLFSCSNRLNNSPDVFRIKKLKTLWRVYQK